MTMTVTKLSKGPAVITPGDIAVHIIFVPDEIGAGERGPDGLPTEQQFADAMAYLGDVTNIGQPQERDVIVFAGLPWHFAGGRLQPHPQVHVLFGRSILDLFIDFGEKAVWWSEVDFRITRIEPHAHTAPVPPYPFDSPPETGPEDDVDHSPEKIHVARSTVPIPGARKHEYKIFFKRTGGPEIDPNMRCN